jgi:membrane protease YdiL (CAAX protease family)
MMDAFLALTAVGLLLGLVRAWTGNIALPAGLHAGWVFVMRATIGLTVLPDTSAHGWLISHHDGYTGWLVLLASVAFTGIAVGGRRHFRRWRART